MCPGYTYKGVTYSFKTGNKQKKYTEGVIC